MSVVELRGVSHRFANSGESRGVLDNVSLDVAPKEIVAVVGESGCGKTTLGRIVAGLMQPLEGEVFFEGQDIWRTTRRERKVFRRAVQLVHQDPYASLNPGLPISEILGAALVYHHVVKRRDAREEMLRLLDLVGLDATPDFLRRYPHQLSGGQRQRLAIARAVSLHPSLVVADEAVSMMDVSIRVSILQLLLDIQRKESLSYLFISHDFGVVRFFARDGRIMVVFYGVIIEEGPTAEVIASPRHPYTWLLLNALPVPDPKFARMRRAEGLEQYREGEPAASGCCYANRCPFVEPSCRATAQRLIEVTPGHRSACALSDRLKLAPPTDPRGPDAEGAVR
ncbi:MAG: ABC transporter ATP-binding protein [Actinomycetota bacterium]|nr:ABC transporter ATP-binding protein [Actinomycetota bacterium]